MKGKYFLDEIEGEIFSTDSFETYILYLKMFDWNRYLNVMYKEKPIYTSRVVGPPANHDSYVKGIKQLIRIYECGYYPCRIKTRNGYHKTVWIKNPEKAQFVLNTSVYLKKFIKEECS